MKIPDKNFRQFELVKGRALFTVAHDPTRPFIVNAGELTIRAIGTAFNVYKTIEDRVLISVSEGKVQINRKQEPMPSPKPVETPVPIEVSKPEQPLLASKSDPVRHFSGNIIVPGQEVVVDVKKEEYKVREVNRYLDQQIVIGDDRLKEIPVTMNFYLAHRKNFLKTLKLAIPINSWTIDGERILIVKNDQTPVNEPQPSFHRSRN